jgi:hypothetical protein
MATTKPVTSRIDGTDGTGADDAAYRDYAVETKPSTKTTELIVFVTAVVLVAVIALVVGDGDAGGSSADPFSANDAMRYITYLAVGYMIARGLAKSGSRNRDDSRYDA